MAQGAQGLQCPCPYRLGQGLVTTEIAGGAPGGQGAAAGATLLHPRGKGAGRSHHHLEGPGLTIEITIENLHLRAMVLGVPAAHANGHPFPAGGRGGGQDPVALQDRRRLMAEVAQGQHRPIGTPDDQGSSGLHRHADRTDPTDRTDRTGPEAKPKPP